MLKCDYGFKGRVIVRLTVVRYLHVDKKKKKKKRKAIFVFRSMVTAEPP